MAAQQRAQLSWEPQYAPPMYQQMQPAQPAPPSQAFNLAEQHFIPTTSPQITRQIPVVLVTPVQYVQQPVQQQYYTWVQMERMPQPAATAPQQQTTHAEPMDWESDAARPAVRVPARPSPTGADDHNPPPAPAAAPAALPPAPQTWTRVRRMSVQHNFVSGSWTARPFSIEPRSREWRNFAFVWNEIVQQLRRCDLVSNAELTDLVFQSISGQQVRARAIRL